MQCKNCKFAKWDRSVSGRLSPTGLGRCMWTKRFAISASIANSGASRSVFCTGEPLVQLSGGVISRKLGHEYPTKKCPVFQPIG